MTLPDRSYEPPASVFTTQTFHASGGRSGDLHGELDRRSVEKQDGLTLRSLTHVDRLLTDLAVGLSKFLAEGKEHVGESYDRVLRSVEGVVHDLHPQGRKTYHRGGRAGPTSLVPLGDRACDGCRRDPEVCPDHLDKPIEGLLVRTGLAFDRLHSWQGAP